jgi:hypothetical protein
LSHGCWTTANAHIYAPDVARYDRCPNCSQEMPAGNLHCFGCGLDLDPPGPDGGSILVQLYPAATQAEAFDFYRLEAPRLAAAGWFPVAHSWGDERVGVGSAVALGDVAGSTPSGTLMVTYRQGGRA